MKEPHLPYYTESIEVRKSTHHHHHHHRDVVPKHMSVPLVYQQVVDATSIPAKRPSIEPDNEASRKKPKPGSAHCLGREVKNIESDVESDARTRDNKTKDPALEPPMGEFYLTDDSEQQMTNSSSEVQTTDVSEGQVSSKSPEISFDEMAMALLAKLEEDKASNSVRMSDFNNVSSDRYLDVGVFTVPESLHSYAKYLFANRPDLGPGNSSIHYVNEMAFVVLCCALKSMDTTHSSEITESLIMKWRDAIRGALQFGFKVGFLKDHLRSATQAHLAKSARNSHESKELQAIKDKITTMEKQLHMLKAQHTEMYGKMYSDLRKTCEMAATKFSGETMKKKKTTKEPQVLGKQPSIENCVAVSTKIPEKRPPSTPGNESSRKKHKHESLHSPRGELENHASHVTESNSRIEDNEIKGPALQPSIAGICSEEDRNKTKADDNFAAEHQMSSDNETTIKQEKIDSCEGQAAGAYHVPDISKGQQEAAATSDPKNGPSNMPENEASTKKRKPESEHCLGRKLEKHASHVVEFDTRIQENHTKDPALEPIIASMCIEQDQEKTKTDAIRVNETICPVLEPSTGQIIGEHEREIVNSEATDGTVAAEQQMSNNLAETSNGKSAISPGKINSREVQAKISDGQVSSESTESCFDKMATQMLEMLEDEKDPDSLRLADFNDIASNRHVDVGIFTVPESLHAYAKHLLATHPDVGTGNSPVHYINEMAFIVLCCTLKSMSRTPLAELTKSLIFKWRDAIRGTLQCGFKVDFLKEHLKFVAQAYLGKVARNSDESKESQAIFDKITTMEKQLELLKASHSEMSKKINTEIRKTCETAAAKFPGATLDFCCI
ncbi:hypothetical protein ACFE04_020750 [Oxalis oulophora]